MSAATQSPAAAAVEDKDAEEDEDADAGDAERQVLEHVVDEFLQVVVDVDRRSAEQYIISHEMNLDAALGAYFDDHAH